LVPKRRRPWPEPRRAQPDRERAEADPRGEHRELHLVEQVGALRGHDAHEDRDAHNENDDRADAGVEDRAPDRRQARDAGQDRRLER
jgi:hypothetical protein